MQRRNRSDKSRMTRITSDDEGPDAILTVPSTSYQLLANGNFSSSSRMLQVTTASPERPKPTSISIENVVSGDSPFLTDHFPLQLDPAYLERLNEAFVTVKRPRTYINPIKRWLAERDTFLAEMLRWEGRGNYISTACSFCGNLQESSYRCVDCMGAGLLCQECVVFLHRCNPLHRVELWTENCHFKKVSLKELGLRIQLGHKVGETCWNKGRVAGDDFVVLDVNGIHEVGVDFCDCEKSKPEFIQLLRFGWFPASVDRPKTAATFSVLKHFQLLNFESKSSPFEFYNTLARLTDNTGLSAPKGRYLSFSTIVREYRHIKMLKRAMRGYDPCGVTATKPGECAVLCPACPQPGFNLKSGWELEPHERRYLHGLFLALDANFRLKRRNVSSEEVDPSFGNGWSYFVSESKYKAYLEAYSDLIIQKRSTCSNHNAVNAERSAKGLAATGVGAVDCARHDMKRPQAVGDLLQGERYVNMDYMFFCSLQHSGLIEIVVSYDIACQWSINLWERMKQYPHWMHTDTSGKSFHFLVPKFHLPAHVMACQTVFSFNFNRHVGRTDGEAPERGWAQINPVATSTSEMGPGHRRDTLDDHFGDGNWRKTTSMAVSFLRKVKEAVGESNDHKFLHRQFVLGLPEASVKKWEWELGEWEEDHSKPNPFEKRFKTITLDGVRKRLAVEEAAQMAAGAAYVLHEEVSASQLVTMGLDFEEQQRQLAINLRSLGPHSTDEQETRLQYRANTLQRKISSWISVQHLYIPGLHVLRERDNRRAPPNQLEEPVSNIRLYLPSAINVTSKVACDARLRCIECDLRQAQAHDALHELRDHLRLRSHVYIDKDRFRRGQRQNTRS